MTFKPTESKGESETCPHSLTDVRVRHVSFVKRAAVRDPIDPTQPRRFLLFKSDHHDTDMPASQHGSLTVADSLGEIESLRKRDIHTSTEGTEHMTTLPPLNDTHAWQALHDQVVKADGRQRVDSQSPASSAGLANDGDGYDGLSGTDPRWGTAATLGGSASEAELSPAAREALQDALRALTPHATHPGVGGLLGNLKSVAEGGNAPRLDRETAEIEKCAAAASEMRSLLGKSDLPTAARERIERAAGSCEREYLLKHSVGAGNAIAARERERRAQSVLPLA